MATRDLDSWLVLAFKSQDIVYALSEPESPRQGAAETNCPPGKLLTCRRVKNAFSPPIKARERLPLNNSASSKELLWLWVPMIVQRTFTIKILLADVTESVTCRLLM